MAEIIDLQRYLLSKRRFAGECWETDLKAGNGKGYKLVKNKLTAYKMVYLHRLSYETFIGPIPIGLMVLHSCDNPGCFNPGHLFLGTNSINVLDAYAKGRWAGSRKMKIVGGIDA